MTSTFKKAPTFQTMTVLLHARSDIQTAQDKLAASVHCLHIGINVVSFSSSVWQCPISNLVLDMGYPRNFVQADSRKGSHHFDL